MTAVLLRKYPVNYHPCRYRFFLDSISNRTIEISFAKINDYKAKYTKYLDLRKDRIEKQIQAKKNQDKFIAETKILINKLQIQIFQILARKTGI